MRLRTLLIISFMSLCGCAPEQPVATLAVTDARIWTGDSEQPWAEAMAVNGERILAVGNNDDIAPLIDESTVVFDGGALIVPGFIPSTLHEIVEYQPTLLEWKVSAGIWALGLMIFTIGLKVAIAVFKNEIHVEHDVAQTKEPT